MGRPIFEGLAAIATAGKEALAGELGLEPRMTVPKTAVLPLHHSPAGTARRAGEVAGPLGGTGR